MTEVVKMEPIAREIKAFLSTLGFNTKHTRVEIKYERRDGRMYAIVHAEGPITE